VRGDLTDRAEPLITIGNKHLISYRDRFSHDVVLRNAFRRVAGRILSHHAPCRRACDHAECPFREGARTDAATAGSCRACGSSQSQSSAAFTLACPNTVIPAFCLMSSGESPVTCLANTTH
jgi:hypothetical protein